MIKTWRHKGLKRFFETGVTSGIIIAHKKRLQIILQRLNAAIQPEDMNTPGMWFHTLKSQEKGYYRVTVNGNWRITFKFEGKDAVLVNYIDYH